MITVSKFSIDHFGDRTVGMFPVKFIIDGPFDFQNDEERIEFQTALADTFELVLPDRPWVEPVEEKEKAPSTDLITDAQVTENFKRNLLEFMCEGSPLNAKYVEELFTLSNDELYERAWDEAQPDGWDGVFSKPQAFKAHASARVLEFRLRLAGFLNPESA